uniref:SH3 domain-containing protein n=1 Tax=Hucho hucho TaxID=62062 RepID=A0A4W5Q4D3_9TELE
HEALYSYEGKEPGDLQFAKGDIIILRRKVDDNWYHGELNSCHGFLPASYIALLRPLCQTPPTGKALYDFEVKDKDQDKDCLAFSKVHRNAYVSNSNSTVIPNKTKQYTQKLRHIRTSIVQADELELRKGEMYRVTEKCQDGWFKGTSLRTAASGVFPGNYVTPVSRENM